MTSAPRPAPLVTTDANSVHVRLQSGERAARYLFDRPGRVNTDQDALVGVEGDQRRRLGVVDLEPVPDDLFLVIVTLEELTAAVVADARHGGGLVNHVPDPLAAPAGTPAGQPLDDLVLVDDKLEDDRQLLV